jgi:tRNA G18 (ribose-2'-O)-methylase SpoU
MLCKIISGTVYYTVPSGYLVYIVEGLDTDKMNGKNPSKVAEQNGPWRQYLIINNVSKWKNIRNMLVSASAFGVEEVFIVGLKKFPLEKEQQTEEQQEFFETLQFKTRRFDKLKECQIYCHERNIRIMGVEIMENAKSIVEQPFQGHTAFLMGNEVCCCYR